MVRAIEGDKSVLWLQPPETKIPEKRAIAKLPLSSQLSVHPEASRRFKTLTMQRKRVSLFIVNWLEKIRHHFSRRLAGTEAEGSLSEIFIPLLKQAWPYADPSLWHLASNRKSALVAIACGDFNNATSMQGLWLRVQAIEALLPFSQKERVLLGKALFSLCRRVFADKMTSRIFETDLKLALLGARELSVFSECLQQLKVEIPKGSYLCRESTKKSALRYFLQERLSPLCLGHASDNGDCFYDSFSASLSELTGAVLMPSRMRKDVQDYLHQLHRENPNNNWVFWIYKTMKATPESYEELLQQVGISAEDTGIWDHQFPVWGRHYLEGCILAEIYGVGLRVHLAEYRESLEEGEQISYTLEDIQRMTERGRVEMALFAEHYVPVYNSVAAYQGT